MSHLENLLGEFSVSLDTDEHGYLGRECPKEDCLRYFKLILGTGLQEPVPHYCPYCGHCGEHETFSTKEQIEYAESIVMRQVTEAFQQDLKALEFDHKPLGGFGIGLSLKVTDGPAYPIQYYREKELETEIVCDKCTLCYAIYGVFGWCPDCGVHNSLQILQKNLELAKKELALSAQVETDLTEYLIGDALKNLVSAFDGFGREICLQKSASINFQNLLGARQKVQEIFGFDFSDELGLVGWASICQIFQKRHLLVHKMGVIDQEYIAKGKDPSAILGRRIRVSENEVSSAIGLVEMLGDRLFRGILG